MKNKALIVSTLLALAASAALYAQTISVKPGWQIVGSTDGASDMSVFTSSCVKSIWTYKDDSTGYKSYLPTSTTNQISSLSAGDGFWLNGAANCTVDTTASSSTSTPPALPPVPTGSSSTTSSSSSGSSSSSTSTAAQGRALYNQYCSSCHGTGMLGVSASQIRSAINSVGRMRAQLSSLTTDQINLIAQAQ